MIPPIAPIYALVPFQRRPIPFLCHPKHLHYLHMKTTLLMKLRHLGLPYYLGLTPTSRWVGFIPIANFPSDPRPCCLGLPSPIFQFNRILCLVRRLKMWRPLPQAHFLKPSLVNTYATHEHVKPRVKPSPRLNLVTRTATGLPRLFQT